MKKILLILLLYTFISSAQQVEWATQYPSLGVQTDPGRIAYSSTGNIAVAGSFYTHQVNQGHFFYCMDTLGNILWGDTLYVQQPFSGYTQTLKQAGLVFDTNGKLYVGGDFPDTLVVDGNIFPQNGSKNFFISKYNNLGVREWTQTYPRATLADLHTDQNNNLFALFSFTDSINFHGQQFVSSGTSDLIIAKIDPNNNLIFSKQLHGTTSGGKIKTSASGNIYILTSIRDTLYFDTFNYSGTVNPYHNEGIILKTDSLGNAKKYISLANTAIERPTDLSISAGEKIIVSGGACWTQGCSASIVGYDVNGNFLFQRGFSGGGGYGSQHYLPAISIADTLGVWSWGFETPTYFYSTPNQYSNVQFALRKIDFAGNILLKDTFRILGPMSYSNVLQDITSDDHQNLYVILPSLQNDSIEIGNNYFSNAGSQTFIVAKINTGNLITNISELESDDPQLKIFPNPSRGKFTLLYNEQPYRSLVRIFDSFGGQINFEMQNTEIDISAHPLGNYYVEIVADGKRIVRKIILE